MPEENPKQPMEMCPMAAMCRGMMAGKSGSGSVSGLLLLLPGLALILGGVLILMEPRVLVWLMGATSILIGIVALVMANFIRKIGAGMGEASS